MISQGNKATTEQSVSRYVGIGAVKVLAINPTAKELSEIYDSEIQDEPEYKSTEEIDGKNVNRLRVSFVVQTEPSIKTNSDILMTTTLNFFLSETFVYNSDKSKIEVIDGFGRTAWVTQDEYKEKKIPVYSNGKPANISADYRATYRGEKNLTLFIKALLGIQNPNTWDQGVFVPKKDTTGCECRLDDIKSYFSGNIKELKDAVSYQKDNLVKVMFGVRNSDGTLYQTHFAGAYSSVKSSSNAVFTKEYNSYVNRNPVSTTTYSTDPLHLFDSAKPTDYKNEVTTDIPIVDDMPFS